MVWISEVRDAVRRKDYSISLVLDLRAKYLNAKNIGRGVAGIAGINTRLPNFHNVRARDGRQCKLHVGPGGGLWPSIQSHSETLLSHSELKLNISISASK